MDKKTSANRSGGEKGREGERMRLYECLRVVEKGQDEEEEERGRKAVSSSAANEKIGGWRWRSLWKSTDSG